MKLQTLLFRHGESFSEAKQDINWEQVTKALDDGDEILAARLIRDPLEAMAEAKQDEFKDTFEDDEFELRLACEAMPTIK
jgi:hypothetical protein